MFTNSLNPPTHTHPHSFADENDRREVACCTLSLVAREGSNNLNSRETPPPCLGQATKIRTATHSAHSPSPVLPARAMLMQKKKVVDNRPCPDVAIQISLEKERYKPGETVKVS